jgi:MFS family permease
MSLYIRLRMKESPIFSTLKAEGKTSTAPIKEALGEPGAIKRIALTLFGATAGQGVVWYCGQFYALYYLQNILNVDKKIASYIIAVALLIGMPFFVVFGSLSDRIGRKKLMMAACLLAAIFYVPIYHGMVRAAGNNVVGLTYVPDPIKGKEPKLTPMTQNPADPGGKLIAAKVAVPNSQQFAMLSLLVFAQVLFVTMIYGPIAAYLVEAFPARVRYTSLSLPYHIGNGVFGGMLPLIGVYSCAKTGNLYAGLAYPITIALITFIIGSLFLKETRHVRIWDELK